MRPPLYSLVGRRPDDTRVYMENRVHVRRPARYRRDGTRAVSHSRGREIHLDTARLRPGTWTVRSSVRDERYSRIPSHDRREKESHRSACGYARNMSAT